MPHTSLLCSDSLVLNHRKDTTQIQNAKQIEIFLEPRDISRWNVILFLESFQVLFHVQSLPYEDDRVLVNPYGYPLEFRLREYIPVCLRVRFDSSHISCRL